MPDTGGAPDPYFGGVYPPNSVPVGFVYNATTATTTTIDGSNLLPGTTPPLGAGELADYAVTDPVLSGNGQTVVFQLEHGDNEDSLFSVNLSNPDALPTPVSPGASSAGAGDDDSNQSVSIDGSVIAYTNQDPTLGLETELYSAIGRTTTSLGPALQAVLSPQGNAVAISEPTDASETAFTTYETSLGVSASIAPIGGNDALDASEIRAATATGGFDVIGTTNAPVGSTVALYIDYARTNLLFGTFYGTMDANGDGGWSAVIPALDLEGGAGNYILHAQIITAAGSSAVVNRPFAIQTAAPTQPVAPWLDPGSDDGSGRAAQP